MWKRDPDVCGGDGRRGEVGVWGRREEAVRGEGDVEESQASGRDTGREERHGCGGEIQMLEEDIVRERQICRRERTWKNSHRCRIETYMWERNSGVAQTQLWNVDWGEPDVERDRDTEGRKNVCGGETQVLGKDTPASGERPL